jgi:hypothetical protein
MKNSDQLVNQFEKYCDVLKKVVGTPAASRLSDALGQRLLISPRGMTEKDGGAPGSLIEFSLEVASMAKKLSSTFGDTKSLVKVSLLHELGKVGDLENDLYLIQESDWHREKLGQVYKYNDECSKMNIAHRTLWILSYLQIDLSREEWEAINVSQGLHLPENQFYANSLSNISAGLLSSRLSVLFKQNS